MLKYILVYRKCNLDIPILTFKCPLVTGFTVPRFVTLYYCHVTWNPGGGGVTLEIYSMLLVGVP